MARHNVAELVAGAVIVVVAGGFLGYAVVHTGHSGGGGTTLHATFDQIDGLNVGSDVRVAGVKIGSVSGTAIDPATFQAQVAFTVGRDLHIPKDSSAIITSDGLLGGKYLSLTPGADDATLTDGGRITITQGSVNIEQLLGKFIFSAANLADDQRKQAPGAAAPAAPK